ncbi:heterodisulfide reductase-related iron-sulfur binding cluster [Gordonia polyisoprenivorans]|uniref:heterodisulfide reductase-related iron-sulfur binding cluster n=1 Tax=Gordonia polyisoprenivorans TaxID=84595 RepID=UPI000B99D608|nr:heterodisulfide reductase-related iron-sulfur binding cluster [Gordonia polyisoprenivorans]OZC32663.1 Fe-S oxidoreductase [Gordonia polyisoprenivorans]
MNATTITIGTIAAVISLFCWALFLRGVWTMIRAIAQGQRVDSSRYFPILPRLWTMLKEFVGHTRMVKFRTVGWAHWLVMFGFLIGAIFWFEAYGQIFDPHFHWPVIGAWNIYIFADEVLGLGTVIGITVLMIIRQLNHPRVPERLSRFSGSRFGAAYFVEWVVLLEGLGMVFVKTFKISAGLENPPIWTSFFTHYFAQLFEGSSEYWVTGAAVIKLMSGMIWLAVVGSNIDWGVAWHRFAAFFNIYLKREADGGVALGAAKPMMSAGKVLDMETADPDVDAFGAGKAEDFSWKAWLDFTTCTECGRCQSQCPAWNTGKPLSPKLLIMSLRDHAQAKAPYLIAGGRTDMGGDEVGLVDAEGNPDEAKLAKIPESARAEAARKLVGESAGTGAIDGELGAVIDTETLWSCTTCGACVEQCPVDIEHVDHIIDMRRYQVLIESDFPTELAGMFKNLENKGNPWGQNSSARTNWIDEMDIEIPVFGQDVESFEGFEYLFWVGCAGAYEDRAKKTTKAVAELLDIAAVNFLVLGEGETCTGDSARRAGNEFLFQMLAQQNIEMMNEVFSTAPQQRKKIVVTCAHCFNALGNEYPQLGATYEVVHHTQLLNRLVREKRLVPVAPLGEGVTYHDPCYLGRHNKVYDAPRELMAASGSNLREMPRHGERSMCCGAGGARMWMEEQIGKRINIDRVDEALDTLGDKIGGDVPQKVATGCPFCRVMLTDGVTARTSGTENEGKVEVVDVAQLLLESVTRGAPEVKRGGRFLGPIPKPAPEPEPEPEEEKAPAAAAASAGTTTEAKPKPKVGLGMKGGKKPGAAKAAPADSAEAGSGDAAAAEKKPAAKGFGMKGGKKPGAAASSAPAPAADAGSTETGSTEAAAAEKKPAAKGFGMKGGKKPGAAAKSAAPAPAEQESSAAVADSATESSEADGAPKKAAAKGFAMSGGKKPMKKPGGAAKSPAQPNAAAADAGVTAPAENQVDDADSAPDAAATADTESAGTVSAVTEASTAKAKGFGMAAGKKRPGAKAAAAPSASATAPETTPTAPEETATAPAESSTAPDEEPTAPEEAATAPAEEPTAPAEDETPAASSDGSASNGSTSDDRTIGEVGASKAKGFGLAAGKKRPGHRS